MYAKKGTRREKKAKRKEPREPLDGSTHWDDCYLSHHACALRLMRDYRAALFRIGNKEAWAEKYPFGAYECIAVECIGIAREALNK